jgi:hypothetical protein
MTLATDALSSDPRQRLKRLTPAELIAMVQGLQGTIESLEFRMEAQDTEAARLRGLNARLEEIARRERKRSRRR